MSSPRQADEQLLARFDSDPSAFPAFYRRHERSVLSYFANTTGRGDLAIDLAAETFTRAFEARRTFDPARGPAKAWLFGIAHHVLTASLARGRVEASARARAGMAALALDERLIAGVEALAIEAVDEAAEAWLEQLPADQRAAIHARVLEDRSYGDIAAGLECSEAVVRQRVSRGLGWLRREMEGLT
jgi:RNA polymerase sigma factor (sigma-70 family)